MEQIYNLVGTKKKLYLLGALLYSNNNKEKKEIIESLFDDIKIKYVLYIFKEEQDKVTLLWRPHPLIENTIKTMLPSLWAEYDKIVKKYEILLKSELIVL